MKYLIFDRPFTRAFTRKYPLVDMNGSKYKYLSDFKYRDDFGLIGRQYNALNLIQKKKINLDSMDEFLIIEVIARDRFLRSLPRELALDLAKSARVALEGILVEYQPDIVIGLPIDNYYLHTLKMLCDEQGIYSLFPVQSFLPGRTRVTKLGEWRKVSDIDDSMVEKYFTLLNQEAFKPTTLAKHRSLSRLVYMYGKEIGKKLIFESLKLLKRDPYSFHYNCIFPNKGAITIQGPKNLFVSNRFADFSKVNEVLSDAENGIKKVVFLPLQFSPESSIDYYISNTDLIDYNRVLDIIIDNLPDDIFLLVKEHPDLYGFRSPQFYERFIGQDKKNIILAPVNYPTSEILRRCSNIVVTGGASSGAEALVRGASVLSIGGAYYCTSAVNQLIHLDSLCNWPNYLPPAANQHTVRFEVVRHILENTLPGSYKFVRPGREFDDENKMNIQNILQFVQQDKAGFFD